MKFKDVILETNSKSAAELFDQNVLRNEARVGFKSREKLIEMSVKTFLMLAKNLPEPVLHKSERIDSYIAGGNMFKDIPYLQIAVSDDGTARVYGHEGRHRAMKFLSMGYETMPVLLKTDIIRWTEQKDQSKFDYVDNWPKTLKGEDGEIIDFPVTREEAEYPYEI